MSDFDITQATGNWQTFSSFLPGEALSGKEGTHFLWQFGSNAGGSVDDANRRVVERKAAEFGDDLEFDTIPSGLRGVHIYSALVRVLDDSGELTPAAQWVQEAIRGREDYPVLDDEVLSELEDELFRDDVASVVRDICNADDLDEDDYDVDAVVSRLYEMGGHYVEGVYPEVALVRGAMEEVA